jgi:hypothetical protein
VGGWATGSSEQVGVTAWTKRGKGVNFSVTRQSVTMTVTVTLSWSQSQIVYLNMSYRKAHALPPSCPDCYTNLFRAPLHEDTAEGLRKDSKETSIPLATVVVLQSMSLTRLKVLFILLHICCTQALILSEGKHWKAYCW